MKKSYLLYLSIVAIVSVITSETSASGHNDFINSATFQQIESRNSLKIDPSPKAIQVSRRNSRKATGVRRIQQGMPYKEARKILIQQGWQPNPPTANGGIPTLVNSGVPECSGTGFGLCKFEFTNEKRELLVVSTISQIEPTVLHWVIDPPTKAIQISRRNPRKATEVRRIQQRMPYREARKILIEQGWQPNLSISNKEIPNLEDSRIKSIYDSGYKEIKDCSGTGLGFCRFEFTNSKGELLVVSTAQEELVVFHWFINPPPQATQVSRRNSQKATEVKRIREGMPYREARKILIEQGWQPNLPISTGDILDLEKNRMVKIVYDRGYGEIKDCSETGLKLCRFEFVNYKSELLVVSTTSLPKLKVLRWLIKKSSE